MEYHTGSHSKYLIKLHVIFVVKYRKQLLTGAIEQDIKALFLSISERCKFTIDVMESDRDHIHILIDTPPALSAFDIVNRLKSMSTCHLYQKHRLFLKKHFWKENTFWPDGYFGCSTGNASLETIRNYIATQG